MSLPATPADEFLHALRAYVRTLVDPALRVAYVRSELRLRDPDEIAEVFAAAASAANERVPEASEALLAMSLALSGPEDDDLRHEIAMRANERGMHDVARRLYAAPPVDDVRNAKTRIPSAKDGRPLTLGERKSLARRVDRNLLARALRDPDKVVVSIVLGNPGVTEDDVVRLCATRPIDGEILRTVFRSPKWVTRPRVRVSIAKNPSAPRDVVLQLLPLLPPAELRELLKDSGLDPVVRDAVERALAPRSTQ